MNTLKEIGNKPVSQLTKDDKQKLYNHHVSKMVDNFDEALVYAIEIRDFAGSGRLQGLMSHIKDMMFEVEEEGVDIGSLN